MKKKVLVSRVVTLLLLLCIVLPTRADWSNSSGGTGNVDTSINPALQAVVEKELAEVIAFANQNQQQMFQNATWFESNRTTVVLREMHNPVQLCNSGAAIVMDMQGRVLAMASLPEDYRNETDGGPLNLAIGARSQPGVLFEPVTAMAGLTHGILAEQEKLSDLGGFDQFNAMEPPTCWIHPARIDEHADLTYGEALTRGCSYFFYTVASRLGTDGESLSGFAEQLGLSGLSGIGLPGEVTSFVGSQRTLYDPKRPIEAQDTDIPRSIYSRLYRHLDYMGQEYTPEKIDRCVLALMEMAVTEPTGEHLQIWVKQTREILRSELGMSEEMLYRQSVIVEIIESVYNLFWSGSESITLAIGESITQVTPIAMARYMTLIANGGYLYDASLDQADEKLPSLNVSGELGDYLATIRDGMRGGLTETTEHSEYLDGWKYEDQMGGRSATVPRNAEIDLERDVWYAAFAPFEDPEIVVIIYLPHAYQGDLATPAIRNIVEWYLDQKDASPFLRKQIQTQRNNIPSILAILFG